MSKINISFDELFNVKLLLFDDIKDFRLGVINLSEKIGVESVEIHLCFFELNKQ